MSERRQWVRFILPNLVTRLSWKCSDHTICQMVTLVNVSAESASVLMELEPPSNQAFVISFDDGNDNSVPISATLVSKQAMESGQTLAVFRFCVVDTSRSVVVHQKKRRAWQRLIPKNKQATLSWRDGDHLVSGPCELLNISGGGVAVRTEVPPRANQVIWLSVKVDGREIDPAECLLVGCSKEPPGKHVARLKFVALCPFDLFKAVEIPREWISGQVRGADRHHDDQCGQRGLAGSLVRCAGVLSVIYDTKRL